MEKFSVFCASLLLLSVFGCSSSQISSTSEQNEVSETARPIGPPSFATAMERNLPQQKISGNFQPLKEVELETSNKFAVASAYAEEMDSYSLLIWQGGKLEYAKYFDPYDKTLRPDSASMHKSVLALLVGAAIGDGKIKNVDEPVSNYLDEWADQPRGDITLRHLLQMSSGLKPLSTDGGATSPAALFNIDGSKARETILSLPLQDEPGSKFHYAGTVSQLLGLIIERATGKSYSDYLAEKIWQLIGADDAYVWLNEAEGFPRTYTSLMARAEDWLRLGLLVKDSGSFEGNQIIPASYIDDAITPSPANPNYGFQIWLGTDHISKRYYNDDKTGFSVFSSEPFLVDDIVYFDGFGGQRVYISRSMDLVIVRTGEIKFDWDESRLPNAVISALNTQ